MARPKASLEGLKWSGRLDSNQRPLHPQRSALPDCATARTKNKVKKCVRIHICRSSITNKKSGSILNRRTIVWNYAQVFDQTNLGDCVCLRDNCFFLGCSSDSSDTEKPDVENKTEVQDESIDDSESILSLFDNTSSFETAGSNDQDNGFFSNNNSTVSKSIGEFPNRASLIEWHKILKAKDKTR